MQLPIDAIGARQTISVVYRPRNEELLRRTDARQAVAGSPVAPTRFDGPPQIHPVEAVAMQPPIDTIDLKHASSAVYRPRNEGLIRQTNAR